MRTRIVAFLIGNICVLYWPLNRWPLNFSFLNNFSLNNDLKLDDRANEPLGLIFSQHPFVWGLLIALILILYKARVIIVSSTIKIYPVFIKSDSFKTISNIVLAFLVGSAYTAFYVNELYPVLDLRQLEGKTIEVNGYIDSIPKKTDKKQSFDFFIISRKLNPPRENSQSLQQWDESFTAKVRLNWYHSYKNLQSGQNWNLKIRLKKPNGLLNGNFDYEKWLFQNRIIATGYVREGQLLDDSDLSFFKKQIVSLRQTVSTRLDTALVDYPYIGLVKALAIGIRHDIKAGQWQAFLRTGTNHLIAISGLHIGLMSSLIWVIVYSIWRSISRLNLKYPASYIASIMALFTAIIYAALAGFAIPTQRALIMLSVVFLAIMFKREFLPSYILLLACLLVVLFDPLSVLSPGFWLSFGAVAIILFTVSSRLAVVDERRNKLYQFGWLQFAIFIGLLPALTLLFHQFSLISPLANLLAVPLMSLVIVPLTLFASVALFIIEPLGLLLFRLLEWPIEFLFWCLQELSQWPESLIYIAEPSLIVSLMVIIGCLWMLMPSGWHGRWLGILLIVPVFFVEAEKIPEGQVQLTMLDVGQGLSMVLRTREHVLVYDVGDKYSEQFNMADNVIIPYFRLKGIKSIDKLVISHSDKDHAGSFSELIDQVPVKEVLAGEPAFLSVKSSSNLAKTKIKKTSVNYPVEQCFTGQNWRWNDVHFQVLSPQAHQLNEKNNNHSCVLLITTSKNKRILLTGDIEKKIEKQLLMDYPQLYTNVLQVPHHGSRTSSSADFLKQLQPEIALFSYGYRNRFHHPSAKVIKRYKKMKVKLYNTINGAIDIKSNMTNNSFSVTEYRVEQQRIWHRTIIKL